MQADGRRRSSCPTRHPPARVRRYRQNEPIVIKSVTWVGPPRRILEIACHLNQTDRVLPNPVQKPLDFSRAFVHVLFVTPAPTSQAAERLAEFLEELCRAIEAHYFRGWFGSFLLLIWGRRLRRTVEPAIAWLREAAAAGVTLPPLPAPRKRGVSSHRPGYRGASRRPASGRPLPNQRHPPPGPQAGSTSGPTAQPPGRQAATVSRPGNAPTGQPYPAAAHTARPAPKNIFSPGEAGALARGICYGIVTN
jgi:hypothetical protein